jgi:hypothetical protein
MSTVVLEPVEAPPQLERPSVAADAAVDPVTLEAHEPTLLQEVLDPRSTAFLFLLSLAATVGVVVLAHALVVLLGA